MITFALFLAVAAATPDWRAIEEAAISYRQQPTADNASHLWSLLPNFCPTGDQFPDDFVIYTEGEAWGEDPWAHPGRVFDKLYALLWCIEPEFLRGRSAEVRLAFRLLHIADAAFADDLWPLLGGLATTRPDIFLHELAELRHQFPRDRLVQLAGLVSPDLAERQTMAELRARRRALRTVTVPQYRELRDACLKEVESSIQEHQ